ncbi:rhodanese-like domain-containing protein [Marimonas arenosa]|uniref:Rhodanese-like domain-containing protein n=1 Tax=Marimonas arenosa TaxID=1795305 RepID=A0AAE3WFL3_9RHOB|nr:rhodanese-like domain-containing protein [Marimonas arenosa]MDQ2091500.1 rhodanese-like domain-containing protein [Marimonas arenosa]
MPANDLRAVAPVIATLSRRALVLSATAAFGLTTLPGLARAQAATSAVMAADEAYMKALADEITLIDIRTPEEWAQTGVPDGALALDMTKQESFLEALVALRAADAAKPIALICRTGNRSGFIVKALAKQGFPGLVDVAEGIAGGPRGKGWLPRGLPTYAGTPEEVETRRTKLLP